MTAADITKEALVGDWRAICDDWATIAGLKQPVGAPKPSRFPPSVASHPAFTQRFNARLVAVGMAASMNAHRRMGR